MNNEKKSLVFFGNERLATGVGTSAPTLQALIDAGYDVVAVVSNYERGTSRNARELEIKEIAERYNIPVLLPDNPSDIADQLRDFGAEIAVLVAYGRIVPQNVIDIFPKGIINIHPSLLPLHRGPTPIESVILDGSKTTGVSVMQLVKAMDAGPVYGQSVVDLSGTETKQQLADHLLDIGSKMVLELLPGILDGSVIAKPQDDNDVTFDKTIAKSDGIIDWNKSAVQLEREVRAYAGWPKSTTTLAGQEVIITGAGIAVSAVKIPVGSRIGDVTVSDGVIEGVAKAIFVQTSDGCLMIERLKPAGKNEMDSSAFINGYINKP
jgi:methionyl-tRNA formyltransferase